MAAPDWIDTAPTEIDEDAPLASQLCVQPWRGNLLRLHEQQLFDVVGYFHGTTRYVYHSFSAAYEWEYFSAFGGLIVPVRPHLAGGWRPLEISAEGMVTQYVTDIVIRIVACPVYTSDPSVDDGSGWSDELPYAELGYSSGSWVSDSDTVTPTVAGESPGPVNGPLGPTTPIPVVYLQAIAYSKNSNAVIRLRGLRIREVPSS